MFDNVAFEVVIGLVFIYLLYSLLATIVGEIISTACGIRQRLLRIAIERMFNDGYYTKIERSAERYINFLRKCWLDVKGWARKVLLYEPEEFKTSFAGKFYEYPAIKYLGRIEEDHKGLFSSTKPAYITPEYFADTLINFLREKGSGATDMDRIGFCLKFNTYHIQPKTLKQFRNLFENAATNKDAYRQNLMKWFNETMDRNNGWYKRKMRSILFWLAIVLAVAFNIDSIRIAKILAKDKEARGQLVSLGIELSKDSARYKDFVAGNGDTIQSKAVLDSGFAHVTKDLNAANLVLGLGWQFDTLRKEEQYIASSKDSGIFKSLLDNQQSFQNLTTERNDVLNKIQERKDAILAKSDSIQLFVPDTLLDDINNIERRIRQLLFENKHDSSTYVKNSKNSKKLLAQTNTITKSKFENITAYKTNKNHDSIIITGVRKYTGYEKFRYFFVAIFCKYRWIGFILTALALCLGAPFWFGVLNKLISIRGVGVNPEEKKNEKSDPGISNDKTPGTSTNLFEEDSISTALRIYADQIKSEKGVVNVLQGYYKVNNKTEKCVQVNVEDNIAAVAIRDKYKSLIISEKESVYLNVIVTGKAELAGGFDEGNGIKEKGICNVKTPNNIGSYGCLVKKIDDPGKIFLLSCYHVMNADRNWENRKVAQQIRNKEKVIADHYEGFLTNAFDIAIAELTDNTIISNYKAGLDCRVPVDVKEVTENDVFNTKVFIQGFNTDLSIGIVANHSSPETFKYPTLNQKKPFLCQIDDLIIITHNKNDSQDFHGVSRGDSGAIVLDSTNNALGIVVGVDLLHTYVIKINTIFDLLGLQLTTT